MAGFHTRNTMLGVLKVPKERVLFTILGGPQWDINQSGAQADST